ncbi:hypothetical protein FPQ18DRAFT_4428 [Pyronema domesticum]|uniref:Uncharacterized protein n=1 Tax=Pyronema omphalodes (strain CBS 100304) TaxID=1076935 RepID=U4LKK5_PYROM|nr:hypothetical protein FPQ18DRAFT_4428 [Pyronema domesticum]CCX32639.1 Similar to hypothetical protein HMPREF1120_04033 [Exophiala dermatitidis NIH/UT8656]; acc. no. EHY55924 [Pyronema omphalodes CBS 100304]
MFSRHHRTRPYGSTTTTSTVVTKKPSLLSRLTRPRGARTSTTRRHHGAGYGSTMGSSTAAPVALNRPRRRTSISDKISGALLRLKGSLTGRPGQKAAGTRRMRGTDGRGVHATTTTRRHGGSRVGGGRRYRRW